MDNPAFDNVKHALQAGNNELAISLARPTVGEGKLEHLLFDGANDYM